MATCGDGSILGKVRLQQLHNTHQRTIAFFNFCIEQGWLKENPAKKIKRVPRDQEETLPFTREQYDALIEETCHYGGREEQKNGETTNSRRARTYLKLLRWSGLRAGEAGCLAKSKLRDDDSLVLYQAKVKGNGSAPVCVLLPREVAHDLRSIPPNRVTHPDYFFWSAKAPSKVYVADSDEKQAIATPTLRHAAGTVDQTLLMRDVSDCAFTNRTPGFQDY